MAVTKAQKMARDKYRSEKRDQITAEVPKGKRAAYHLIAKELRISLAQLIQSGVEEYARIHAGEDFVAASMKHVEAAQAGEVLTTEERRLVELFGRIPERTRKNFLRLFSGLVEDFAAQVDDKSTVTFGSSD